jgi:hypothetical protein
MRTRVLVDSSLATAVGLVVIIGSAGADSMSVSRGQPVAETAHAVAVHIASGVATFTVQRQFYNPGNQAEQVGLEIRLPEGAAATGLRIKARQRWYTGELMEASAASERYRSLTGYGAHDMKDPALLSWMEVGTLFLQVFPVMPKTVSTVEYTLTVPTSYAEGSYSVTYPRLERPCDGALALVAPVLTVDRDATIDGQHVDARVPATLATATGCPDEDSSEASYAQIIVPGPATTVARLGRVVASSDHAVSRLELDAAPRLSKLPVHAQVVFVVDASYSVGDALAAELEIARAYARVVPDAEIELVAYRRTATRVFGGFVPATAFADELTAAVDRGALALGNGSALEDGARLAATALAGRSGPKRIVVLTDELVRPELTPVMALARLAIVAPDTVVHVVGVDRFADPSRLVRDDAAAFASLATSHHGMFVRTGARAAYAFDRTILALVRPTSIDRIVVAGLDAPSTLDEGSRLLIVTHAKAAPSRVVITGQLWSDPIRIDTVSSDAMSRATAAFMTAERDFDELTPEEQMTVALAGRAVSRVTSYVAYEPGTRPSRVGFSFTGVEGGVEGGVAGGDLDGVTASGILQRPDLAAMLGAMLDAHACFATDRREVTLAIDTTRDEIVDVAIVGAADPAARCVAEATWRVRLDNRFDRAHERFTIVVRPR